MTTSDAPPLPPDQPPVAGTYSTGLSLKVANTVAVRPRAPRDSALRRRRLQTIRHLKTIAQLREQLSEQRAEISSLESIIGAQADVIDALLRQKQEPED